MKTTYYFLFFFFFNDTATTEIYTLSLHDALPISTVEGKGGGIGVAKNAPDRDVAFAFIDWWLQQDSLQAQWMSIITYPAPSKKAYDLLDPKIAALMPYSTSHTLPISVDPVWQYDNLKKEEAAFQQFLTG